MSFDLAGLLQRNTQNTLSGLSSSASAGRTDMSSKTAEGAQAGSLTVGSAISGQVIKVEGDTVYVKLPSEGTRPQSCRRVRICSPGSR